MWTAARLVSAVLFAAVGYFAARAVSDTFPEELVHTWFEPSIAAIGLWQGWMVMGGQVGKGYGASIGNGLRTSVQITFFGLLLYALRQMFLQAVDGRYGGNFGGAIMDAMNIFLERLLELAAISPALMILGLGGMAAGIAAELASRIWR